MQECWRSTREGGTVQEIHLKILRGHEDTPDGTSPVGENEGGEKRLATPPGSGKKAASRRRKVSRRKSYQMLARPGKRDAEKTGGLEEFMRHIPSITGRGEQEPKLKEERAKKEESRA